jgi:hypothetical protein
MLIREILEDDLTEIFSWFETRKWPLPAITGIGPRMGMMAIDDRGVPMSCAWLYLSGTAIADIDWVATNPDVDQAVAMDSVGDLVERLQAWSKGSEPAAKIRALRLFTKSDKLVEVFEKRQFRKAKDYTRLLWTLKD